ncbi:MAG TPA: hypothetical protein VG270_13610 [Pseudolabrys sp.]|nr:hypothetical protein [Pseudolabrys sp.]
MTPPITGSAAASPTPAGPVTGQTSTHLPQRVQASIISPVRAASAVSNAVWDIGANFLSALWAMAAAFASGSGQIRPDRDALQQAALSYEYTPTISLFENCRPQDYSLSFEDKRISFYIQSLAT